MIRADGVTFAYQREPVLREVGLVAGDHQVVGLIGPNGSGKTTLLRTLFAALQPDAGLVSLDGNDLQSVPAGQRARAMSVVAQEGVAELPLTVAEVVRLGRLPHRRDFERYTDEDREVCDCALERVGATNLAQRVFGHLSGGERQRVLIARALAQQARHLLLDEPTNHLDVRFQHEILRLVRQLGVTTVVVLHDLNLAARYCDHLVLLDRGRVTCSGSPEQVLAPATIERVYGIGVRRVISEEVVQLVFQPLEEAAPVSA